MPVAVLVFRPELRDPEDAEPFEGLEIVGLAPNNFAAHALLSETQAKARAIGQAEEGWKWMIYPIPEQKPPEFTWTGWMTAEDSGDGDVPDGYEWLSIDEDGEEFAIIALRTKASIFDGKPDDLTAARAVREIRANAIVRALNEMVARGDYP